MPEKFEIVKSLLCEDVREEINNKHTLIGVYIGDVLISRIPGNMSIALFVELDVKKEGKQSIQLRLSGPGDHEAVLNADLNFIGVGSSTLKTPRIELLVDKEGIFRIDLSEDGETWINLIEKSVTLNPAPSASPQPSEQSPSASPG